MSTHSNNILEKLKSYIPKNYKIHNIPIKTCDTDNKFINWIKISKSKKHEIFICNIDKLDISNLNIRNKKYTHCIILNGHSLCININNIDLNLNINIMFNKFINQNGDMMCKLCYNNNHSKTCNICFEPICCDCFVKYSINNINYYLTNRNIKCPYCRSDML